VKFVAGTTGALQGVVGTLTGVPGALPNPRDDPGLWPMYWSSEGRLCTGNDFTRFWRGAVPGVRDLGVALLLPPCDAWGEGTEFSNGEGVLGSTALGLGLPNGIESIDEPGDFLGSAETLPGRLLGREVLCPPGESFSASWPTHEPFINTDSAPFGSRPTGTRDRMDRLAI